LCVHNLALGGLRRAPACGWGWLCARSYFYMEAKEVRLSKALNALAALAAIPAAAMLLSVHAGVLLAVLVAFFVRALRDADEAKFVMWMTLSAAVIAALLLPFSSGYDFTGLAAAAVGGSLAALLQWMVVRKYQ